MQKQKAAISIFYHSHHKTLCMHLRLYIYFTLLAGLFYCSSPVVAQSYITLEGAQVFSNFKYIDSKGVEDKGYSSNIVSSYGLGYQYLSYSGLFVRAGINMRKAGSKLIYNKVDYVWSLQYTDFKAGVGFQFGEWRLKPTLTLSPYYAYLLEANQTVDSKTYDLKAGNSLKNSDIGLYIAPGLNTMLSNYASIYVEFNYLLGLQNIEPGNREHLYNRGFSLNFGLLLNVKKLSERSQTRMGAR